MSVTYPWNVDGHSQGVYFASRDCAGLVRRGIAGAVDAVVLYVFQIVFITAWLLSGAFHALPSWLVPVALLISWWVYLAPLKRSRWKTLGYRIMGIRIVDLTGAPPSLVSLTVRCTLLMTNPLIDLVWMTGNLNRQKISDQLAGTYVIRNRAQPAGTGRLVPVVMSMLTYFVAYGEVKRAATA